MGGTHKKKLRAEKAKVKLKAAKLPKGLNVTKTDFKVRKITIREQLKGAVGGPLDIGGQQTTVNLKETLTRLKHHGSNIRLDAQRDLREAIAAAHTGIAGRLSEVMMAVSGGVLDVEREPRRDSFKTLSCLLGALPPEAVAPFFHIAASYLRCAMTHIEPQLQEDSLLMLDVLLQHVPQLVAANSERIFAHFLEMISRVRTEARVAAGIRTLSANVGQRQTSVRWRTQVLQRLQRMLTTLGEHTRRAGGAGGGGGGGRHAQQQLHELTHLHSLKEAQYFPLVRGRGADNFLDLSGILSASLGWQAEPDAEVGVAAKAPADPALAMPVAGLATAERERATRRRYVQQLMPLLLEAWMEVRPSEAPAPAKATPAVSSECASLLTADAGEVLHVTLNIIELLWQLVEDRQSSRHNGSDKQTSAVGNVTAWLRREYGEDFANAFQPLGAFPYQQHKTSEAATGAERAQTESGNRKRPSKKVAAVNSDPFCLSQNLSLALLMGRFFSGPHVQQQAERFAAIVPYLQVITSGAVSTHRDGTDRLLEQCLRLYLLQSGRELLAWDAERMRQLLLATIEAARAQRSSGGGGDSNLAGRLLLLLCDIVQQPTLMAAYGDAHFTAFLAEMPQLLLQPVVSAAAIAAMSTLAKQNNGIFLRALAAQCTAVLGNLMRLQVLHTLNAFEGKKQVLNLFYWPLQAGILQPLSSEELDETLQHMTDKRIAAYCRHILSSDKN